MNKVINNNLRPSTIKYRLSKLVLKTLGTSETAFIGKCGHGPDDSLYLITYSKIILASNPHKQWSGTDCVVLVRDFVDVEIKVI